MMLANSILPFFIPLPGGSWEFFIAILAVILIESAVIQKCFKVNWKRAIKIIVVVNILSSLIGGFACFFIGFIPASLLFDPENLIEYSDQIFLTAAITYFICFLTTVLLEWWGVNERIRKQDKTFTRKETLKAVIIANLISYAVLCPWHYYIIHKQQFRDVVYQTDWAEKPAVKIFFLNEEKAFCSIFTDGSGKTVLIARPIEGYIISQDLKYCVYWQQDGSIFCYNLATNQNEQIVPAMIDGKPEPSFEARMYKTATPNNIAISPDNNFIVWTASAPDSINSKLYYYNITTKELNVYLVKGSSQQVAFSANPSKLYLINSINGSEKILCVAIQEDNSIIKKHELPECIASCYGRFGHYQSNDDNMEYKRQFDIQDGVYGSPYWGLRLDMNGKREYFNDTHFLIPQYFGTISSPTLLDNKKELIIEARGGIYLMDISEHKFGLISQGSQYVIKSEVWDKNAFYNSED
jgi:hemin uptake protein HemP